MAPPAARRTDETRGHDHWNWRPEPYRLSVTDELRHLPQRRYDRSATAPVDRADAGTGPAPVGHRRRALQEVDMNEAVTTSRASNPGACRRSYTRRLALFAVAATIAVVATVWLVIRVANGRDPDAAPVSASTVGVTDVNGAIWASSGPVIWGPDLAELDAAFWAPPPVAVSTVGVTEMYGAFWATPVS
jgi:hypothetical protein